MPRLSRILINGLAGLILVSGFLAAALRLATPYLNDYRARLSDLLSAQLDTPVTIGRMSAEWVGWGPRLSLYDISLGEGPIPSVARRADFALEFGALVFGRIRLQDAMRLTVDGLRLHLIREPSGQLHIQGLGYVGNDDADNPRPPPIIPNHLQLSDARLLWEDRRARKPPLDIGKIDVDLRRDGQSLRLRAVLQSSAGRAELAADLVGLLTRTDWYGETYLRVSDLDVASLLAQYLPAEYRLDSLELDLNVWSTWREAVAVDNLGRVEIRDLAFSPTQGTGRALAIPFMRSDYRFRRNGQDLDVILNGLEVRHRNRDWPISRAALSLRNTGDQTLIRAAADFVRLEDVLAVLQVRFPWAGLEETVAAMQPSGDLHDLRLDLSLGGDRYDWRGALKFEELSLQRHGDAPGFSGLSGRTSGNPERLSFELDSRNATLDFGALFSQPLQLDRLAGKLDFTVPSNGTWRLRADAIQLDTPHLSSTNRLLVERSGDDPLWVDLQTDFRKVSAPHAALYYPRKLLRPSLVDWLEGSIGAGVVDHGTFLLNGPVQDFPYAAKRNGVFEVLFAIDGLDLDYQPGWPALRDVSATLRFHENSLDIDLHDGLIHNSKVTAGHGRVASLDPISPLEMTGSLSGPLADELTVLGQGALENRFGHIARALTAQGNARLDLDFAVPIDGHGEYWLDGALYFDAATVSLKDWNLAIEEINGRLVFDLDSLSAVALQARALDSDVIVDILPLTQGTTRVVTYGAFSSAAIAKQLPWLPLEQVRGTADFVVKLDVPGTSEIAHSPLLLTVESDLAGIDIDLPQPLGKRAAESRPLVVEIPLVVDDRLPLTLNYGNDVSALFTTDGRRGTLQFGGGAPLLQRRESINLRGHMRELDLAQWQALLEQVPQSANAGALPPMDADLALDRLSYGKLGLNKVSLKLKQAGQAFQGTLYSEQLTGEFVLPADTRHAPLQVALERMNLTLDTDPGGGPDKASNATGGAAVDDLPDPRDGPDPRELPPMQLQCAQLHVNQARLGELRITTRHTGDGLAIDEFSLKNGEATLDSKGSWTFDGSRHSTELSGTLASENLGDLLMHLGYKQQIEKSSANIQFDLSWPGNPFHARAGNISALADLEISEGRLLDVDPGVTRVVGLLNFNALNRRLRLDFTDLARDGFSFDHIAGTFDIEGGNAYTNELLLEGPSGTITVGGRTGLVDRDFDQQVSVTPSFDATLPIASTLSGGPLAGLAVLVAQKVMSKQLDEINRFEYSVVGPWSNPEITQLKSGGMLSRLLGESGQDGKTVEPPPPPAALPSSADTPGL